MLQKTWSNFIFSTLHTCEGPKRCPKANLQIRIDLVYLPEYLIFVEISCLALPEKSYLLRFGKIRLATGPRRSIGLWRNGQNQWCFHSLPFWDFMTIQNWSKFTWCLCIWFHSIWFIISILRWPRSYRHWITTYASWSWVQSHSIFERNFFFKHCALRFEATMFTKDL